MASRAPRSTPRHTPRRGAGAYLRAPQPVPPFNGYATVMTAPVTGFSTPARRPTITVVGTSTVNAPVDIQLEWRMVFWDKYTNPPAVYTSEVIGAVSGTPQSLDPPADLTYRTWYYRARTGNKSTNTWGLWTEQKWLNVRPTLGSTATYIDVNIGVTDPPINGAYAYIDMNIGTDPSAQVMVLNSYIDLNVGIEKVFSEAFAYADINVGLQRVLADAFAYADINVADGTPAPHIWWIRPVQGKDGYTFNIFGHGFGAFKNEYTGKVMLGNYVCDISSWKIVPSAILPVTVEVAGTPRATASTTALPSVSLNNAAQVVIAAGDIIEYDMMWESPASQRLDIFPSFAISSASSVRMGYGSYTLNDTLGRPWISDQPEAYGAWLHRKFVVPTGHILVGRTLSDFTASWYESNAGAPVRKGAIRSFVIRGADNIPKLWVMGDDHNYSPPLTYTANTGVLTSATIQQEGFEIEHGLGLDPDMITAEYGWIVAVVPTGAVSSMVRVVLEG